MTIKDFENVSRPDYNVIIFERDSEAQRIILYKGILKKIPQKIFERNIWFFTINYVEQIINIEVEKH